MLQKAAQLHQQGQLEHAFEWYQAALKQHGNAQTYYLAGNCLAQLGQYHKAIPYLVTAIDMDSKLEDAYLNLAICQEENLDISDAKATLAVALDLFPQNKRFHNRYGNILIGNNQYAEAIDFFFSAIRLDSTFFPSYVSLAQAYEKLDQLEEARDTLLEARKITSSNPIILNNLANILRQLGSFEEARELLFLNLSNEAMHSESLHNLGKIEQDIGNFDKARSYYQESLQHDPNNLYGQWNLGLLDLGSGIWENALDQYRLGRSIGERPSLATDIAEWHGQALTANQKLLIVQEQGIGEELMFSTLYQRLSDSPATVHVICSERLIGLLSTRFPGIVFHPKLKLEALDNTDYDYYVFAGDLPWLLNITPCTQQDKSNNIHLTDTTERKGHLRIGISWRGGKNREEQGKRNIPLDEIMPIFEDKKHTIINLQHDANQGEIDFLRNVSCNYEEHPEIDLKNSIDSVAQLIQSLDFVICCTNSIAHIAAFNDKTCYMLTPISPTWYWMFEGDKSIWYPSLFIIRQKKLGSWKEALSQLTETLEKRYSPT